MTRILTAVLLALCLSVAQASAADALGGGAGTHAHRAAAAELSRPARAISRGVATASDAITSAASRSYLTAIAGITGQLAERQAESTVVRIGTASTCTMAINTGGIIRANTAIVRDGRVFLRSRPVQLRRAVRLADASN